MKTIILIPLLLFAVIANAQTSSKKDADSEGPEVSESDFLKSLDYPELNVVPRATERLSWESREESDAWWRSNWAIQVSSAATLANAIASRNSYKDDLDEQKKADAAMASTFGMAVGGGWILGTVLYQFTQPYRGSLTKIAAIPKRDKKSELLRERLAEEAIEQQARIWSMMKWFSVASNLAANISISEYMSKDSKTLTNASIALSLLPLLFESRQVITWKKHQEYKRKIYSPFVSYNAIDQQGRLSPSMVLTWVY